MDRPRPRIGVIGAGAMGTLFGFYLAEQCDVTMLDANPSLTANIARDGVAVNDSPPRRVTIAQTPRDLYGSNVLFLFVKAVDTLRALRPFAGELNPASPIVSLQNGVGNEDAIKTALGGAVAVILGITTESSLTVGPGRVRRTGEGHSVIGSASAAPATSRMVADLLASSGLRASVVYDIRPHLWGKLVANAAINALSALLDCEAGFIVSDPNAAHVAEALAEEAAAVAAAQKINLPIVSPWQYVTEVVALGADAKSSMAYDLDSGHPSEIDHINGAVAAFGRRTGTATPYNDAVMRLVKASEALGSLHRGNSLKETDTFTVEQAAAANAALRAALGLPPEQFSAEQFVGMISDEIEQLRSAGRTDGEIAQLLDERVGVHLEPDVIARYYASEERRRRS